ncbi:MAG: Uma2 family endonuclease [Saprospiraceae bacterium]|nr:Uma2 family endonuclease [Saprospiraceae bacterium]
MTAISATTKKYTLEAYFELEYTSSEKHEYLNGKIKNVTYTAKPHGKIVSNLLRLIGNYLEDSELEVFAGDRMLYVPDCNKVYYPDLIVLPQNVETYGYRGKMEADLYPVGVIEILSDSTEDYDYEDKWHCYQKISTLKEYMLVSQKLPFVQVFHRQSDKEDWLYHSEDKKESSIQFAGCSLALKDIYKRVSFPPETTPGDESL